MLLKQLSVFIENRAGRLEQVTEVLSKNEVNIASFSLADTSEYGLLRLIVDDPVRGREVLKSEGFSAVLTDVIAIELSYGAGALNRMMRSLKDVNVEYIYILSTGEHPSMIIKSNDAQNAVEILEKDGFHLLGEEAYTINN